MSQDHTAPEAVAEELQRLEARAEIKLDNRRYDGNRWQVLHIALGVGSILLSATTGIAVWAQPTDIGMKILLTALGALGSACGAVGTFLNAQLRSIQNKAEEGDWRAIHSRARVLQLRGTATMEDLQHLQAEEAQQIRADADARLKSQSPSLSALLNDFDLVPKNVSQPSSPGVTPSGSGAQPRLLAQVRDRLLGNR